MQEWEEKLREAKEKKQWDVVEFWVMKGCKADANGVYLLEILGEAIEKQGRVDEAIQYYEKALATDRRNREEDFILREQRTGYLRRLDILYRRKGQYEDSLRVCKYYTEHYPYTIDGWHRLRRIAKILKLTDLYKEADKRINPPESRAKVPMGKAIRWTEEEIEAEIAPTPENIQRNIQEVIDVWKKYAKHKDLIDAELRDDKVDDDTTDSENQ